MREVISNAKDDRTTGDTDKTIDAQNNVTRQQ